jgi:hypothetical protein
MYMNECVDWNMCFCVCVGARVESNIQTKNIGAYICAYFAVRMCVSM